MHEETVHNSQMKERLAFEVLVNRSEMLSLLKEIIETTRKLSGLSQHLMQALTVSEDDQSR